MDENQPSIFLRSYTDLLENLPHLLNNNVSDILQFNNAISLSVSELIGNDMSEDKLANLSQLVQQRHEIVSQLLDEITNSVELSANSMKQKSTTAAGAAATGHNTMEKQHKIKLEKHSKMPSLRGRGAAAGGGLHSASSGQQQHQQASTNNKTALKANKTAGAHPALGRLAGRTPAPAADSKASTSAKVSARANTADHNNSNNQEKRSTGLSSKKRPRDSHSNAFDASTDKSTGGDPLAHDRKPSSSSLKSSSAAGHKRVHRAPSSSSTNTTTGTATTTTTATADAPSQPPSAKKLKGNSRAAADNSSRTSSNEDTEVFCICRKGSFGHMIACDNSRCKFKWFHYHCVNVVQPPKGKWFCPNCRTKKSTP